MKENLFDNEATAANMKLSEIMKDDTHIPHGIGEGEKNSVTEANLKIQEAFYMKMIKMMYYRLI